MRVSSLAIFSTFALGILHPVLSSPTYPITVAQNASWNSNGSDWIPASIVSYDFVSTEGGNSQTRPLVDAQKPQVSLALTSLGHCLQDTVRGWPKKTPTHQEFKHCVQTATGAVVRRGDPDPIFASPLLADGDTGSGVCSVANTILSNFLTGKDMEDLAQSACEALVTVAGILITKDMGAIASALTVQGGHKKGLSIVHKHRNLQIIGTVANVGNIAKARFVDLCTHAVKYQAETCIADLRYGSFNHQMDHVAKPSTTIWRDAKGAVQAIFDIGFAMPGALA